MVAEAKPDEKRTRQSRIPLAIRLKARNLYLTRGLPPAEVAALIGLSGPQVSQLAHRDGWAKLRRINERRLEARHDARANETLDEVSAAIANECDEIALSATTKAKEALVREDKDAAKDFQAITGGLRNVVSVARTVRGLDGVRREIDGGNGATINLAFFVGNLGAGERASGAKTAGPVMRRAEPATVEIAPASAPVSPTVPDAKPV